jgi:signal peptidase I
MMPGEAAERSRKPWLASLLTLIQPGLGHLYVGRWDLYVAVVLSQLALLCFVGWVGFRSFGGLVAAGSAALVLLLVVLVDAYRRALGAVAYRLRRFNNVVVYVLAALGFHGLGTLALPRLASRSFLVVSGSMEPTLEVQDRVMTDRRFGDLRRGDIVVYRRGASLAVHRIVALGGERVEIRDKQLIVDSSSVVEAWAIHRDARVFPPGQDDGARRDNHPEYVVPAGHVFVLGDNRDASFDSRFVGPVAAGDVIARVLYRYWAVDRRRIGMRLDGAVNSAGL